MNQHDSSRSSKVPTFYCKMSSKSTSSGGRPRHPMTYLVIWFYSLCRYLLITPFRIQFDQNVGQFLVHKCPTLFRILVLFMHTLIMIMFFWILSVMDILGSSRTNFTGTLLTLMMINLFFVKLNFFLSFWRDGNLLENFLNQLNAVCHTLDEIGGKILAPRMALGLVTVMTLYLVIWVTVGIVNGMDMSNCVRGHTPMTQTLLCHHHRKNEVNATVNEDPDENEWSSRTLLMIAAGMTQVISTVVFILEIALILVYAITMYLVGRGFSKCLQNQTVSMQSQDGRQQHLILVMQLFDDLCQLSGTLNGIIGVQVWCTCFGPLMYFSFRVLSLFKMDTLNLLQFLFFTLTLCLCFVFSAEANSKISNLVHWLQLIQRDCQFFGLDHHLRYQNWVSLALAQVSANQFGVHGRVFVITFGFMGKMAGLLVTNAMIIMQLTTNESSGRS